MAPSRVVIEADGGSRGNPGPAALGAVLRDAETGQVIAERSEAIGVATNNVAEYSGLIAGLELLHDHAPDATDVDVRMDSKLVVEQMSGRWKVKHPDIRPLAARAKELAPFGVTWTWVPRADNTEADRLVNLALDEPAGPSGVAKPATDPSGPTQVRRWSPDLGPPTRLILLRHGETDATAQHRFSGTGGSDPSLNAAGTRQAEAAAAALGAEEVSAVLSSPLARARQTADVVAEALGLRVEVDDALREAAFGAWDGLSFGEVRERWPDELDRWLFATDVAPPGGETFDEVLARVRQAHDRILRSRSAQTVLVVTHSTPIKLWACAAIGAPTSAIFRIDVVPGSVSVVEWYADGYAALRGLSRRP